MVVLLANAPLAAAQKGKGKGKRNSKEKFDQSTLLLRVALLLVDMDRRLGALEDRASSVVVVRDEDCQNKVRQMRELWRSQHKERRDGAVAGQGDAQVRGGKDVPGDLEAPCGQCFADCGAQDVPRAGDACFSK